MNIEAINERSPHLDTVKAIGRANAETLGHFPNGAFEEYAARKQILVALNDQGHCVGYLLYYVSRHRAKIVHLCVETTWRGKGVSEHLFDNLYARTQSLRGIQADCRRDYAAANRMWQRLGFCARGERPGRGHDRMPLTIWWCDHGHPDLFTLADEYDRQTSSKIRVVMDANVFFDLVSPLERNSEESQALLADWLQDEIDLCITSELLNEINRGSSEQQRRQNRSQVDRFTMVQDDNLRFREVSETLRSFFPDTMRDNDTSDLRQMARTIAADVSFFITRDEDQLRRADAIYDAFGLSVLSPSYLIVHLDKLRREIAYRPARLAGTSFIWQRLQLADLQNLAEHFQRDAIGETKSAFLQYLRRLLAKPHDYACSLVLDDEKRPFALLAYGQHQSDRLTIAMFRMRRGPLAATLGRYFLLQAVQRAVSAGCSSTHFIDPYPDEETLRALQEDDFIRTPNGWHKINLAGAESTTQLAQRLQELRVAEISINEHIQRIIALLQRDHVAQDTATMVRLEQMLWPVKITNAAIPTFIIPIRPHWAEELFDEELAEQTLFGATRMLTLNREGVYYRACRPAVLAAPGRILWYVSGHGTKRVGTMAIRACSRLDEVAIDTPGSLFRHYRRLGIYEWSQVRAVAQEDVSQNIMAVRFSSTELFPCPVSLKDIQYIYREEIGKQFHIQGPVRVPQGAIFTRIYQLGQQQEDQ
jgi:ribosomal protein S18 acetylase RimI-like enzyme/predicted nucleic acid-binding protein